MSGPRHQIVFIFTNLVKKMEGFLVLYYNVDVILAYKGVLFQCSHGKYIVIISDDMTFAVSRKRILDLIEVVEYFLAFIMPTYIFRGWLH